MKKELGKWLMDIAKYLVTAVVLATIFSDMQEKSILILGAIAVALALASGLYLVRDPKKKIKRKKQ